MLYDPKWDKQEFIEWLGQQPKNKTYPYIETRHCAVAQFLQYKGCERQDSDPSFEKAVGVHGIVAAFPHTFGAAYRRATGGIFIRFIARVTSLFCLSRVY